MPQIAQQDYKVIAPKEGRTFHADAAALGELKKAILNGIGFDCLIKDTIVDDGDINRVLGFYPDGSAASYYRLAYGEIKTTDLYYTVGQYQGLAAVQNAVDEASSLMDVLPDFTKNSGHLLVDDPAYLVCVDGKFLTVTGDETIESLTIAETGPTAGFVNITWEDAQKLIGLPLI